ncbi:MAG: hypothetical protein KDD33_05185 [Bdellovibrionales bacterium]|nr:hypothetical protein [Bdellovibrionales bacterium]
MPIPNFFSVLFIFLKREWRTLYPSSWALVSLPFAELFTLTIYWFTAKALSPKLEFQHAIGSDYFQYIVVGELTLLIPAAFLYGYSKIARELIATRGIDYLAVQPFSKVRFLVEMGIAMALMRLVNMAFTLLLLIIFFSTALPPLALTKMILLVLSSLPSFFGLGLMAISLILVSGRGERLVVMVSNASYVLAGVYFPTQVFPSQLERILNIVSPFNLLLNSVRKAFLNPGEQNLLADMGELFLGGLVSFALGWAALRVAFARFHRRQRPLI